MSENQDVVDKLQPLTKLKLPDLQKIVPLKNTLLQSAIFKEISDKIIEYLNKIPNLEENKLNNELILLMCNMIESLCKKKHNIDKAFLLIQTLKRVCSIDEKDEKIIRSAIQFFWSNGKIKGNTLKMRSKSFFLDLLKRML